MSELTLETHPNIDIRVEHVGAERIPLLIIDNLVDRPDDLVAYAASDCTLAAPADMYPGLRAPAPQSYLEVLRKGLTDAVNAAYSLPDLKLNGNVKVGHHPDWLTFTPDGKRLYVANAGSNSVSVVDVAARKELLQIPVGQTPKRNITAVLP